MKTLFLAATAVAFFAAAPSPASVTPAALGPLRKYQIDLEAGAAWQARNDFAVPGDTGTRVALSEYDDGPVFAPRAAFVWNFKDRWSLRFLAAPLRVSTGFTAPADVAFNGKIYPAGDAVAARYRFDTYRAGFYYRFAPHGAWTLRAGGTVLIRDAEIAFDGSPGASSKTNTGVVPLLYGGARWDPGNLAAVDFEVDALGASQGRVIDASVRMEFRITERFSPYFGYRVLDGGADNDTVFNFATFHYALAGASIRF